MAVSYYSETYGNILQPHDNVYQCFVSFSIRKLDNYKIYICSYQVSQKMLNAKKNGRMVISKPKAMWKLNDVFLNVMVTDDN